MENDQHQHDQFNQHKMRNRLANFQPRSSRLHQEQEVYSHYIADYENEFEVKLDWDIVDQLDCVQRTDKEQYRR